MVWGVVLEFCEGGWGFWVWFGWVWFVVVRYGLCSRICKRRGMERGDEVEVCSVGYRFGIEMTMKAQFG